MSTTLSFRASSDFIEETQSLADLLGLKNSEYVREAVREKNERVMAERLAMLSRKLSAKHQACNASMDDAVGDGLV